MPRIATLSLIPLAISIALRGRNRFPEIFDEPAALVMRLDAEHHSHRRADLDARGIGIGEFDHHPPAAVELDSAAIIGRLGGVSEAIGGVSQHSGGAVRGGIILFLPVLVFSTVSADLCLW